MNKQISSVVLIGTLMMGLAFTLPVNAQNIALSELKNSQSNQIYSSNQKNLINKDHWAYKTLEDIQKKYNLNLGKIGKRLNGKDPISRDEAAIIFVNLIGKIQEENLKVNEAEKAKIEILQQELGTEISQLSGRVEKLQSGLNVLEGRVSKLEDKNKKLWGYNNGEDFKVTGGLQGVFYGNFQKGDNATPANFSLPWGEINFSGKMHNHLDYFTKIVPTRNFNDSRNSILEDAYLVTDIIPHHQIYLGQTAIPFGIEAPASPMDINFIEYSQIAANIGQGYSTGIMAEGDWGFVNYKAGAYNGADQNSTDPDSRMSLVTQLTVSPFYNHPKLGDLKLGGSYLNGNKLTDQLNGYAAHVSYNIGKLMLGGEYMATNRTKETNNRASGWYTDAIYQLTNKLQLLGRFDSYNPNNDASKDLTNAYTLGTNYALADGLLLMVNYSFVDSVTGQNSNRLGLLTQVAF